MKNRIILALSIILIALLVVMRPQKDDFICIIKRPEYEDTTVDIFSDDSHEPEKSDVEEPENWTEVRLIETPDGMAELMSDGILFYYQMPFDDVMGYKGYYTVTFLGDPFEEYVWHHKEFYAEVPGLEDSVQIAESYGFEDSLDTVRDLNGDGVTELICNCQTGGDGAQRVYLFYRTCTGIEKGCFNFDDLLPENAILDHGTVVEYKPESDSILLEYTVDATYERKTEVFNNIWRTFIFETYDPDGQ